MTGYDDLTTSSGQMMDPYENLMRQGSAESSHPSSELSLADMAHYGDGGHGGYLMPPGGVPGGGPMTPICGYGYGPSNPGIPGAGHQPKEMVCYPDFGKVFFS